MRQKAERFMIPSVWIFLLVFFISSATALTQLEAGTSFYEDFDDELNGRTPLILIHGIHGKESDWSSFTDFFYYRSEQDFGLDLEKLYKLYFFTYDSNKISVEEIGEELRSYIDSATQNEAIDDVPFVILAHSMGGLVSRTFLQKKLTVGEWTNHFAGERVVSLITLGTPHHGSPAASSLSAYQKCFTFKLSWLDFLFLSNNIYWCSRGFKFTDDFSCLAWDEYNRKDLLWDDYDEGFNYSFEDINDWLQELNLNDLYRSRIIAYYSAIDQNDPLRQSIITCLDLCSLLISWERELCALSCVSPALPIFPQRWQLTVASAIMGETLDYVENDGMVPLGSGSLEGYSDLAGRRHLTDLSHGEIKGDELEIDSAKYFELFNTLKSDLESLFQGISISPENPRVPVDVTFNTKDNGYLYEWQIEDPDNPAILTGPQVSHVFRKEGTYLITLTTTDDNGGIYPSQRTIQVHGPRIDVEYDDNDAYIIRFHADNNALLINSYEWDFGDGSEPNYIADPVHEYMMNGTYDVSLTLTLDDESTVTGSTLVPIGNGPTYVTGILRNNITWRKSRGPYIVENLSIAEGATLTIEPGTVVKIEKGPYNWIDVRGTLLAQGTAEAPIIFTSLLDDAYGGDTNGDGDATSPAPGDWAGIEFDGYYGSGTGILEHCVIRYGGTSASHAGDGIISYGNLSIRQSSPIIRFCEITDSAEHGIYVYDNANPLIENCTIGSNALTGVFITDSSYPTIIHNTFQNNGDAAIDAQSFDHLEEIRDNTFSGNGQNGLNLTGILSRDTMFYSTTPIIIQELSIDEGATLTIEPGTVVKVEKGIYNWIDVRGTLLAQGTAEAPIIFTSLLDDAYGGDTNGDGDATSPAPGDWAGIEFDGYYGSGTGSLEHCVIRYGGTSASHAGAGIISYGNLSIRQSSPTIRFCEITHSAEHGIYVYDNANPLIENCTIGSNALTGVFITDSSYPTIIHNTFQDNVGYAIDAQSFDHLEEIRDNTFSGNGQNGLNLTGVLSRDTMFYSTTPIIIQELSIDEGATLTIEPGTVVKVEKGIYNWIDVRGTLLAQGTAEAPIIFTSLLDDAYGGDTNGDGDATSAAPGDWAGIEFDGYYGSGIGTLEHCVIRYGGTSASHGGAGIISYGNLSIRQSSPIIRFCEITHSAEHGIYVYDNANPLIENCTIGSNALTGVFITDSSYPTIIHNTFQDNVGNAIDAQSFDHLEEIRGNTFSGNGQNGLNLTGILSRDTMFYSTTPIIIQELSIDEGATLTIEPGTVVKVEKGIYNWIDVRGTLLAQGTAEAPIIFTSLLDDAYGGDTNGDGDATSAAPGDWAGIEFDGYYGSGTGSLEHCVIRYGGTSASLGGAGIISYGNLSIRQSSPTIRFCEITHSAEHGIYIYNNANPLIENSVFSQNANYGVGIFSNSSPTIRECTIAWNDAYGVYNNDGTPTLVNSIIWYNNTDLHQVPYDMISYCNTGDSNLVGTDGNISAPPLFAPDGYHLTQNSPCVDAGTLNDASVSDIDGHDRPYGDGIDMGADEWQGEHYCRGDFNIDGTVDEIDLIVFALDFGKTACYRNCKGDFDGDGDTDGLDLTTFTIDYRRTDCP